MKWFVLAVIFFSSTEIFCQHVNNCEKIPDEETIKRMILNRQQERQETFVRLKNQYVYDKAAEDIVSLPVQELIHRLQSRSLSAVETFEAFMAKSIQATDSFNCIAEFIPFALETAQALDKREEIKGPLHGLPICVKDDHDVEGMDTTLGLGKNLNKPADKNSVLVQAFIDLGAIPFCKTNIPQTLFSYASDNPIYGETKNPLNVKLAPGGSSAGTACIVRSGGVVFGTGTDIAGSVRIPAHFSGLSTLKPTYNRLSDKGILAAVPKIVGFKGIPGIIAKEVDTVAYVFKSLTVGDLQNHYDPRVVPIPWNEKEFDSKNSLRIGFYTSLSFFPAIGDTIETVLKAKNALEKLGHTLLPFEIENDWEIMRLMNDVVSVDFGNRSHLKELFQNEPEANGLEGLRATCGLPDWKRKSDLQANPISKPGNPSYSARATLMTEGGIFQAEDMDVWDMMYSRDELLSKMLSKMEKSNLDIILAPVFPFPACRLNDTGMLFGAVQYTMLWNFLDFPAGVVPYGIESGKNIANYDHEGDSLLRLARDSTLESIGSPIGVQLIGKPFKEELVLRVMTELSNTIGK